MKYTILYLGFGCGGYIIGYNVKKGIIKNYIKNKKENVRIFNTKKLAKEYIEKRVSYEKSKNQRQKSDKNRL